MDLNTIMPWLGAVALILSLGNTITGFLTGGAKKTAADLDAFKQSTGERFSAIDRTCDEYGSRIQNVESELKHLPDRTMVHDLQLTLKDIQIEMAAIKASTEQSTRTSRRVEDFLMTNGRGGA